MNRFQIKQFGNKNKTCQYLVEHHSSEKLKCVLTTMGSHTIYIHKHAIMLFKSYNEPNGRMASTECNSSTNL